MTNQEIVTEVRGIIGETNPSDTHVTDTQMLAWCNECTLRIMGEISTYPIESVTGEVAAATVVLDSSVYNILTATMIDDSGVHHQLKTTDFSNFNRLNMGWQNTPTGKPSQLVRMTDTDWKMYPAPDATWTGKSLSIYAIKKPTDRLINESPAVAEPLHGCYPHYVAWKSFLVINNPEAAGREFSIYKGMLQSNKKLATATDGALLRFRIEGA